MDWIHHLSNFPADRCLLDLQGGDLWCGTVEPEQNDRMGLGYHQLRLVGWYWSRRNTHLRYPLVVSPGLENRCKPGGRSNDDICGYVCGPVPDLAHGPGLDGIFRTSLSEYKRTTMGKL